MAGGGTGKEKAPRGRSLALVWMRRRYGDALRELGLCFDAIAEGPSLRAHMKCVFNNERFDRRPVRAGDMPELHAALRFNESLHDIRSLMSGG